MAGRNMTEDARRPGGHPARLGLTILALLLGGAFLLQVGFSYWLRQLPVFGPDRNIRWAAVNDRLPVVDVLLVKYGHALRSPRFSHGLFGNSRAVGVSHRDLGLPEAGFFNFAVGGTSFRQSAALVQMLHDAGKLPDIVIISLDNHDLNFFGHVDWPGLFAAPGYHLKFLRQVYDRQPGPVLMAKTAAETVLVSIRNIVNELNIAKLAGRWGFMFGRSAGRSNYDADGARMAAPPDVPADQGFRKSMPVWPGMAVALEADIVRLGQLAASGVRIIVYESPLDPQLADIVAAQRDATTIALRSNIRAMCNANGVVCLDAPVLPGSDVEAWPDCCHAPPASLGRFIAGLF